MPAIAVILDSRGALVGVRFVSTAQTSEPIERHVKI